MHLIKIQRIAPNFLTKCRKFTTIPNQNEEYTETPEYPPIQDLSLKCRKERETEEWSEQIRALKTVEEKQMKLNMPKYYGWKTIMLDDHLFPYNSMHFIQFVTKTHFKEITQLPEFYKEINVDTQASAIKSAIEDSIAFEMDAFNRSHEIYNRNLEKPNLEEIVTDSVLQQINRIIINHLNSPHLSNIQIDLNPRHEAFWFIGGIDPPDKCIKLREKLTFLKDRVNEPINRAVQYMGKPSIAIRNKLPLKPIISYNEADNPDLDVPFYNLDPRVLGFNSTNRHGTNIPGFWPGDPLEFGLISFQRRSHILRRLPTFGDQDNQEALHSHGILSSFAWLASQASYQGFTPYNDLTYPLVAQTVITNGQDWNFYTYQLNTMLMHSDFVHTNKKRNICWGLKSQKLFESVHDNGKIVGFNDEILKTLLKFYLNVPAERLGEDMKPFLGREEKIIAEIPDDEKRDWLEKQYKHMMSNRPRSRQLPEVYHWEKIYKIDHKTRVMEARRRPFELNKNPWDRKYDERSPSYIPKALRPDGPKSKDKFYKSYYP